jgi:LacI family transcriptional regulator
MLGKRRRPTAIFASNDDMALGCMAAADALSLQVPGDVSIAGFDDSTGARFSRPQLTTLHQPLVELAEFAARALIAGTVAAGCDEIRELPMAQFVLVSRGSTAAPQG